MGLRLILISTACLSYLAAPALGTSLLAAAAAMKGSVIGAGLAGAALSSSGGETVVIQANGAVQATPAHQVVLQQTPVQEAQPVLVQHPVHYQLVHPIPLMPVATITPGYSFTNKISNLWSGISNAIYTKTRLVGDFFRSLKGQPRIVLINVPEPTTSTTKKPKKTTTTPRPNIIYEIVAVPPQAPAVQGVYQLQVEDCVKK